MPHAGIGANPIGVGNKSGENSTMTSDLPNPAEPILVACLCAEWCGVCREYRNRFQQVKATLAAQGVNARFFWIDVEDQADFLHPVDVEDFPTLLIAVGSQPYFFGTLTPQVQTLERMVRNAMHASQSTGLADITLQDLTRRLWATVATAV